MLLSQWSNTSGDKPAQLSDLGEVFKNVTGAILALAGIVLFILFVTGGIKYITAGGDPKGVEEARKTITTAIIGFIVVACSYLILVLIEEFTGAKVTNFNVIGI